jgi:hypothetical protein
MARCWAQCGWFAASLAIPGRFRRLHQQLVSVCEHGRSLQVPASPKTDKTTGDTIAGAAAVSVTIF